MERSTYFLGKFWPPIKLHIYCASLSGVLTFAVRVENIASYDVSDIIIRGYVPSETSYIDSNNSGVFENGFVIWKRDKIKANSWLELFKYRVEINGIKRSVCGHVTLSWKLPIPGSTSSPEVWSLPPQMGQSSMQVQEKWRDLNRYMMKIATKIVDSLAKGEYNEEYRLEFKKIERELKNSLPDNPGYMLYKGKWKIVKDFPGSVIGHHVRFADSENGLDFFPSQALDGDVILEHVSVLRVYRFPDDSIRILGCGPDPDSISKNIENIIKNTDKYDLSKPGIEYGPSGYLTLHLSKDGLNFKKMDDFEIKGLDIERPIDPFIIILPDGKIRLYYHGGEEERKKDLGLEGNLSPFEFRSAISVDGTIFKNEGVCWECPVNGHDPEILHIEENIYKIFVGACMAGPYASRFTLCSATSYDGGQTFHTDPGPAGTYGFDWPPMPIPVDGGYRHYDINPRIEENPRILSWFSEDGVKWKKDNGIRIEGGLNPWVIKLKDGIYRMYYQVNPLSSPPK